MQGLESTVDELPLHSQAGTVFPWSERQTCALTLSSRYVSSADKFQTLSLGWCFRWVQLGAIPVGFPKSSHCGTPSSFQHRVPSPLMDENHPLQSLLLLVLCSLNVSYHTLFSNINHSLHPPILSSEGFPYISVEKRFWKCDQQGSPTTLLNFCGTQVSN